MLKISLIFKKVYKPQGQITRNLLGIRKQNFQGIVFV